MTPPLDARAALVAYGRAVLDEGSLNGYHGGDPSAYTDDALLALVPKAARATLLASRSCPLCGVAVELGSMCATCSQRVQYVNQECRTEGRREAEVKYYREGLAEGRREGAQRAFAEAAKIIGETAADFANAFSPEEMDAHVFLNLVKKLDEKIRAAARDEVGAGSSSPGAGSDTSAPQSESPGEPAPSKGGAAVEQEAGAVPAGAPFSFTDDAALDVGLREWAQEERQKIAMRAARVVRGQLTGYFSGRPELSHVEVPVLAEWVALAFDDAQLAAIVEAALAAREGE